MSLLNFFKKHSLRKIIIYYILLFTMIPSIVLCTFFYTYSIKTTTEKYLDSYLDTIYTQCEYNINTIIYNINMMVLNITLYQDLYNTIFGYDTTYDNRQEKFAHSIEALISDNSVINGVEVITNDGLYYHYHENNIQPVSLSSDYLSTLTVDKLTLNSHISTDSNGDCYLVMGKKFYNTYNAYNVGYIVIYVSESYLRQAFRDSSLPNGSFFIAADDLIISHTDKSQIGTRLFLPEYRDGEKTIIKNKSKSSLLSGFKIKSSSFLPELKIYSTVSYNEIYEPVFHLNRYTTLLLLFCLIVSFCIALLLPKKLLKNIILLKKHMTSFSVTPEPITDMSSNNEIIALEASFNNLLFQIDALIRKNNEEKEQKRIAELQTLQSQINPHFIYNALDTICWMAKTQNQTEISDITVALATFFRLGLQKGSSVTTIENEIKHVKAYLAVEHFRFPELFDVEFELDNSVLKYKMVKILLQPLVENAVLHAFEDIDYKGLITVKVYKNPDNSEEVCFEIIDNGIGMETNPENIVADNNGTFSGFGLYNVRQRLAHAYGAGYDVTIQSAPNKGTKIKFKVNITLYNTDN